MSIECGGTQQQLNPTAQTVALTGDLFLYHSFQVCNHPELFEEQSERLPLYFCDLPPPALPPAFGKMDYIAITGKSHVTYSIPKLLYREGMAQLGSAHSGGLQWFEPKWLGHCLSVAEPNNVHELLWWQNPVLANRPASSATGPSSSIQHPERQPGVVTMTQYSSAGISSTFGFSRFIGMHPSHLFGLACGDPFQRWEVHLLERRRTRALAAMWAERWHDFDQQAVAAAGVADGERQPGNPEASSAGVVIERRASHAMASTSGRDGSSTAGGMAPAEHTTCTAWQYGRSRRTASLLVVDLAVDSPSLRRAWSGPAVAAAAPPLVLTSAQRLLQLRGLLRAVWGAVIPVLAPPAQIRCSDRGFEMQRQGYLQEPWSNQLLLGVNSHAECPTLPAGTPPLIQEITTRRLNPATPGLSRPLMDPLFSTFGASPPMQQYALAKALVDSGKLLALDGLLGRLKSEGHRVLLFCQMTQMMSILEDYLTFRRHRYLRLDGSSSIAERRDMVQMFQTNPSVFIFMLSTRAGGLGINLTAADTVIFYESDWNPTMDLQVRM